MIIARSELNKKKVKKILKTNWHVINSFISRLGDFPRTVVLLFLILSAVGALLQLGCIPANAATAGAVYYGSPYYCDDGHFGGCGLHATLQGAIQGWWAAYKAYWGVNDSNCSYYYTLTGSGGEKRTFVLMYIYGTACGGGPSGIYGTAHPVKTQVSITATKSLTGGEVTYPTPAGPTYGHVVTYSDLTLQVTKNGQPVSGISPPLKSDRGSLDSVTTLGDTNASGVVGGDVATRSQPGNSTITSASTTIATAEPAVISWLPAQYSSPFEVTCYSVAHEKYDTSGPKETMSGLPGKHHKGFISKSNMQGTGYTLSGNYIQKRQNPKTKKWYWKQVACPHTASGYCAQKDHTIAVDRSIIPLSSLTGHQIYGEVYISGVGDRVAQDSGGGITGYHIDLYYGPSQDDYSNCMNKWGINGPPPDNFPHGVTLENYLH